MKPTPAQFRSLGWWTLAAGLLVCVLVTLYPERLKSPAWVAYLAGLAFVFAGCVSLARAWGRDRLADGIVCLLLAAFTGVELWIAFGSGARHCAGRVALFGFPVSELSCRGAFAIGAILVAVMLAVAVRGLIRQRRTG